MLEYEGMYFLVHVAIILLLDIVCFLFVFPVAVPCLEKYSQVPTMHPRITMLYIHTQLYISTNIIMGLFRQ